VQEEARQELQATVEARRELGPEHEEHLIAGFLDRIEKEIDARVDARVAGLGPRQRVITEKELAVAVPIVAVAGIFAGATGVVAVAAALAVVFIVLTVSHR
jgi:hypothetical protein